VVRNGGKQITKKFGLPWKHHAPQKSANFLCADPNSAKMFCHLTGEINMYCLFRVEAVFYLWHRHRT